MVTNQGGRTCHAAIIAREMGITAIVGTEDATDVIKNEDIITLSCCEGDEGKVYPGALPFHIQDKDVGELPLTRTQILMNVGNPEQAFKLSTIPCEGLVSRDWNSSLPTSSVSTQWRCSIPN